MLALIVGLMFIVLGLLYVSLEATFRQEKNMIKIINPNQSHPEIKHLESGATFQLPHGSGIDTNWTWVDEEGGCLSFHNEWHALDNNGCYCGWIPFEVIKTE